MTDKDKKSVESIAIPTLMLCPHCRRQFSLILQLLAMGNLIDE